MSRRTPKKRKRKRRSESDILLSTLKKLPKKKAISINAVAKRTGSTWRTAKKNIQLLEKAGIVKRERASGRKRPKYRKKE